MCIKKILRVPNTFGFPPTELPAQSHQRMIPFGAVATHRITSAVPSTNDDRD